MKYKIREAVANWIKEYLNDFAEPEKHLGDRWITLGAIKEVADKIVSNVLKDYIKKEDAISSIRAEIEKELPERLKIESVFGNWDDEDVGFNKAITEVHEVLDKVFEVDK